MAEIKDAAVAYAENGFKVFPLNGKNPATKNGFYNCTDEPDDIRENWSYPGWNVGVVMGNGLIAIDVDRDDSKGYDGHETVRDWEKLHGELPETASYITGRGGYQLLYLVDRKVYTDENLERHIDIRSDFSYSVFPPSIHPDTHRAYEWENHYEDVPIAWADDNVYKFIEWISKKNRPGYVPDDNFDHFELPDKIYKGERDRTLYRYGCSMRAKGIDDNEIYLKMHQANKERCVPPMPDYKVDKKYRSVMKRPPGWSDRFKQKLEDEGTAISKPGKDEAKLSIYPLDESGFIKPEPFDVDNIPELPPALIDGVMLKGGVLMLGGASKAGKTFMLLQLALGLATGNGWMGFGCLKGKVLYVNLEVHPAEISNRARKVFDKCYTPDVKEVIKENLHFIHLRGKIAGMEQLVNIITMHYSTEYDVIIIDPSYKVIDGDENAAKDVHVFTNQLDRLATECEASVIYCHHHSKGAKGDIKSSERVSGSGVFSRHADAVIDLIELSVDDELREDLGIGDNPCFRMEFTTRSFQRPDSIDTVFRYPVHRIFEYGELSECKPETFASSGGKKSGEKRTNKKSEKMLEVLGLTNEILNQQDRIKVVELAELVDLSRVTLTDYINEIDGLRIVKIGNTNFVEKA